jgi:cyanophycinase-like exopeptidase
MRSISTCLAVLFCAALASVVTTTGQQAPAAVTTSGQQAPATERRTTPTHDVYFTGNAADVTPPTKGGLQLEGGGTDIDDAFRWFIAHAGGGDIVILRASGGAGYNPYFMKLGPVDSVESIVFKSRDASSDKDVIRSLEHAEGVFIAGGDQSNYVKYWKGTPVETTLNALAKRGVPIGGTSACSVGGRLTIVGGHERLEIIRPD